MTRQGAAAGVLAAAAVASGALVWWFDVPATGAQEGVAGAPSISLAQAREIALSRAASAGDPGAAAEARTESAAQAAASMSAPAEALTGATAGAVSAQPQPDAGAEAQVDLVTLHGSFVLSLAHVPRGFAAPRGNVLQVAVAPDGFVLGLHLGEER